MDSFRAINEVGDRFDQKGRRGRGCEIGRSRTSKVSRNTKNPRVDVDQGDVWVRKLY